MDGAFHTYTIEWTSGEVRFYIDGIHQHTAKNRAPDSPADVIVGLREVAWAGRPQWKSGQEMLVDWVAVEPLP
jgi:beta-glucanase (GH16 family)